MSIFQGFSTKPWAKSVKSRRDAEMASISDPCGLAGSDATRCTRSSPISSHFDASNVELRGPDPGVSGGGDDEEHQIRGEDREAGRRPPRARQDRKSDG